MPLLLTNLQKFFRHLRNTTQNRQSNVLLCLFCFQVDISVVGCRWCLLFIYIRCSGMYYGPGVVSLYVILYLCIVFHARGVECCAVMVRTTRCRQGGSWCAIVWVSCVLFPCKRILKGAKTTKKRVFSKKKVENVLQLKKKPYICTRFTTVTALQMMTASLAQLARARDL